MKLNKYGQAWVDGIMGKLAESEDAIYASIGANDPEAVKAYMDNERVRITEIAVRHQDDPEFQLRIDLVA